MHWRKTNGRSLKPPSIYTAMEKSSSDKTGQRGGMAARGGVKVSSPIRETTASSFSEPDSTSRSNRRLTTVMSRSGRESLASGSEQDITPRNLIQNMLTLQATAQPVTRQQRQRLSDALMRPPASALKRRSLGAGPAASPLDITVSLERITPRTNILGFLEKAPEQTPVVRTTGPTTERPSSSHNISSFTVNEVAVSMIQGRSSDGAGPDLNTSAREGRFRGKKRKLNIQLPEASSADAKQAVHSSGGQGSSARRTRQLTAQLAAGTPEISSTSQTEDEEEDAQPATIPGTSDTRDGEVFSDLNAAGRPDSSTNARNIFNDVLDEQESGIESSPSDQPAAKRRKGGDTPGSSGKRESGGHLSDLHTTSSSPRSAKLTRKDPGSSPSLQMASNSPKTPRLGTDGQGRSPSLQTTLNSSRTSRLGTSQRRSLQTTLNSSRTSRLAREDQEKSPSLQTTLNSSRTSRLTREDQGRSPSLQTTWNSSRTSRLARQDQGRSPSLQTTLNSSRTSRLAREDQGRSPSLQTTVNSSRLARESQERSPSQQTTLNSSRTPRQGTEGQGRSPSLQRTSRLASEGQESLDSSQHSLRRSSRVADKISAASSPVATPPGGGNRTPASQKSTPSAKSLAPSLSARSSARKSLLQQSGSDEKTALPETSSRGSLSSSYDAPPEQGDELPEEDEDSEQEAGGEEDRRTREEEKGLQEEELSQEHEEDQGSSQEERSQQEAESPEEGSPQEELEEDQGSSQEEERSLQEERSQQEELEEDHRSSREDEGSVQSAQGPGEEGASPLEEESSPEDGHAVPGESPSAGNSPQQEEEGPEDNSPQQEESPEDNNPQEEESPLHSPQPEEDGSAEESSEEAEIPLDRFPWGRKLVTSTPRTQNISSRFLIAKSPVLTPSSASGKSTPLASRSNTPDKASLAIRKSTPLPSRANTPVKPGTGNAKSTPLSSARNSPIPGTSSSASAQAKSGKRGGTSLSRESLSQERSGLSAASRLSSRFQSVAESGSVPPDALPAPASPTLDDQQAACSTHDQSATKQSQVEAFVADTDEDSEEEEEGYSPLKTPRLPPKKATPATNPTSIVARSGKQHPAGQTVRKRPAASRGQKRPGLPSSVIKAAFTHFCKLRVTKDAIQQVEALVDQYWDNLAQDLEAFAAHSHRSVINETDFELLMKRQGFITDGCSLNTLIAKYLPLELRQQLIPIARSGNRVEPNK